LVSDFAARVDSFLGEYFAFHPLTATTAGMHAHDAEWPAMTAAGRAARLEFYDRWTREFEGLDVDGLSIDDRVDRDLLLGELAAYRFGETELREDTWSPLEWVYMLGDGLFTLIAREFAPLAERLASVAGRLEGIPAVLDAARTLLGSGERPVARLHTEKAIAQWAGIAELVGDALAEGERAAAAGDAAVAEVMPRLRAAADAARSALDAFERHLADVVLPASQGEGRLGGDLFATKMVHTLRSTELTPAAIQGRALREWDATRAEMVRIAREIWPAWYADAALEIRWTPVFLRSFGGAMLDWPGPLDHGQKAFFSVTPIPEEWTPDQAESYLREDNDRMLQLLTIHEAVPGHYLQGVYGNRSTSLPRAIFWSGVFAEGWAVYVTQVMMDFGFAENDPALLLCHWKYYLRCVANVLIDIGIHTQGMTEDEA